MTEEKVEAAFEPTGQGCLGTPTPEPDCDAEPDCCTERVRIPTLVERLENEAQDLEKALTETRELIALLKANPDAERIFTLAGRRRGWV